MKCTALSYLGLSGLFLPDVVGEQESFNSESQAQEEALDALRQDRVAAVVDQDVDETGQREEEVDGRVSEEVKGSSPGHFIL